MMEINLCYACMGELNTPGGVCPHCGFDNAAGAAAQPKHALPCGTVLAGHYLVGRVIGQGGFGITYMAWNLALEQRVCVKEYFPAGAAVRSQEQNGLVVWGSGDAAEKLRQRRESFVKEARKAVRLSDLNSIVKVWDVFYENETAYIVMNFIAGQTLKSYLVKRGAPLDEQSCLRLLEPVMRDLEQVHRRGIVHRDIKPENLMLQPDGQIVLLDLGAAKDLSGGSGQSSFVVASQGFSPLEQYNRNGNIGAWTDVYAMCATIYYCVFGRLPPTPTERMSGEEIDLQGLSPVLRDALEKGLAIKPEDRVQSMNALLEMFKSPQTQQEPQPPQPQPSGENDPERRYGNRYRMARTLMEQGQYDTAEGIFTALGTYMDSAALAAECKAAAEKQSLEQAAAAKGGGERGKRTEKSRKRSGRIIAWVSGILIAAALLFTTILWIEGAEGNTDAGLSLFQRGWKTTAGTSVGNKLFEKGNACLAEGDYDGAMKAYREAAAVGNGPAMTSIGHLYENGLGVEKDNSQAFAWFRRGAEAGDSSGMFSVGLCYYYERGVARSYSTALEWCLKAARAGNAEAMNWVSDMYRYGQGTEVDLEKADEWRQKALDAGYVDRG